MEEQTKIEIIKTLRKWKSFECGQYIKTKKTIHLLEIEKIQNLLIDLGTF